METKIDWMNGIGDNGDENWMEGHSDSVHDYGPIEINKKKMIAIYNRTNQLNNQSYIKKYQK